jgi:hypothetical protein
MGAGQPVQYLDTSHAAHLSMRRFSLCRPISVTTAPPRRQANAMLQKRFISRRNALAYLK